MEMDYFGEWDIEYECVKQMNSDKKWDFLQRLSLIPISEERAVMMYNAGFKIVLIPAYEIKKFERGQESVDEYDIDKSLGSFSNAEWYVRDFREEHHLYRDGQLNMYRFKYFIKAPRFDEDGKLEW